MQTNNRERSSGAKRGSSPAGLRRALARARAGKSLDVVEAELLLGARGEVLDGLLRAATRVRDVGLERLGRPGAVTYSRKVFIPLTRLCRDRCRYCTFATTPGKVASAYLSPEQVLAVARAGAAAGCKEAFFTLGDRPEVRWRAAQEWLDGHGYEDTVSYLRAMAVRVLEETGLLPHLNPGVLSWTELARLKPVAPSMGMMLESTSRRLFDSPGGAHFGCVDKDPAVRLRVLEDAGRSNVAFTTGLLVGIGESAAERAETIFAIRDVARRYGGVQEVIVQNVRAKPGTAMRGYSDAALDEFLAAVAVTRLVCGAQMRVQARPILVDFADVPLLLAAGVDDLGGISPPTSDHVNPERAWPDLDALAGLTAGCGFTLRERLAVYPDYQGEPWLDPRLAGHVAGLAGVDGLAAPGVAAVGRPWQEPDPAWGGSGRTDLNTEIDREGRHSDRRSDFEAAYGDWAALRDSVAARPVERFDTDLAAGLRAADRDPGALSREHALALITARGAGLDAVTALADALRAEAVGANVTYVVNRNINFTNVCYTGCRFCAFAQRRTDADAYTLSLAEIGTRVDEAAAVGATEVCMQGGIHPDLPGHAYFDIAAEVKRRQPAVHLHAFSPMEVVNGAARANLSIADWLTLAREAGVDSLPGTAAEILDDDIRWVLTKGKLPTAIWIEVVTTAHRLGIPTTATMMYGHVDTPAHWVDHLQLIARLQDQTGGFTEFVPLPFVHYNAPIYLAGLARPGSTRDEDRAVHALARILLHGRIPNIQCSWVKLGADGCAQLLRGGCNDLGGTLMEETISRMAGSTHGSARTPEQLQEIAASIGRPARQRTTLYHLLATPTGAG